MAISIDPPGGAGADLTVREEGTAVDTTTTDIDFVGTSVTATASGNAVRVEVTGGGDVSSSSTIGDNKLVRGDGGSKGIQDSGITVDDSDNLVSAGNINVTGAARLIVGDSAYITSDNISDTLRIYQNDTLRFQLNSGLTSFFSSVQPHTSVAGDIDLGNVSRPWRDIYMVGSLILDVDDDTSIGSDADDTIQVIAGGTEVAEFSDGANSLTLASGISAAPDTDTGFVFGRGRIHNAASDVVYFSHIDNTTANQAFLHFDAAGRCVLNSSAGAVDIQFRSNGGTEFSVNAGTGFAAANAAGPVIFNEAATATNPTFCPDRSDATTGIGGAAIDGVSVVVSGTEMVRVDGAGDVQLGINQRLNFDDAGSMYITSTTSQNLSVVRGSTTILNFGPTGLITSTITPSAAGSRNLGSAILEWNNIYYTGNLYIDDDNDSYIASDADDQVQVVCSGVEVAEFRTNQVVLGNDVGLVFEEVANVPGGTPAAGTGTVWLHSDVPNTLHFTDDSGTDHDLVSDVYGDIYVESGTTTQVTNGSADTFDVVTGFNTTEGSNGEFSGTNPVKASNKITLDKPGRYMVTFTCSYEGTSNTIYTLKAFIGGAAVPSSQFQRKIGTGSDVGSSSFQGILSATAGQDLDVRVSSPDTSVNFIPRFMNLSALWIGI